MVEIRNRKDSALGFLYIFVGSQAYKINILLQHVYYLRLFRYKVIISGALAKMLVF